MPSKYKDPATITCPKCSARSSHRVAELLGLKAGCPSCATPLVKAGLDMRRGLDEWSMFVAAFSMLQCLKERLGASFTDDDAMRVKTLRHLTSLIAERLEQAGDVASQSIELTTWAVAELKRAFLWQPRGPGRQTYDKPLDLDAPLLAVLDPGRWDHPSSRGSP